MGSTIQTTRSLEDLTEEQIQELERIYGAPVRRPSVEEKRKWKRKRRQENITGQFEDLKPKGKRTSQKALSELWHIKDPKKK